MTRSSVDLPVPLRPISPSRSPTCTMSCAPSRSGRSPKAMCALRSVIRDMSSLSGWSERRSLPCAAKPASTFSPRNLCHDLDFGDPVRRNQPCNLDRGPCRKRRFDVAILDGDDGRHLGGEVGVKGSDIDDITPGRAGGLQGLSNPLEGSVIAELRSVSPLRTPATTP